MGLNINVNRPGTNNAGGTGSGTITNQTGVTQTGYADLTGASNANAFLAELSNIGKGATEARDTTDSYLTLVTCTPPGTTWKRLIIKAKLEI